MAVEDARRGGEQRPGLGAGRVLSEQPDQHGGAAERGDIAGDIAGAAEHALRPPQQQHRHRRLGRDALGIAIREAVEHHIAETQDRGAREIHAA